MFGDGMSRFIETALVGWSKSFEDLNRAKYGNLFVYSDAPGILRS
jgi:hypothetical protein